MDEGQQVGQRRGLKGSGLGSLVAEGQYVEERGVLHEAGGLLDPHAASDRMVVDMHVAITEPGQQSQPTAGGVRIDSARHPLARRIADVLRSRSARPKTILIDDAENIAQALSQGVELECICTTASVDPPALSTAAAVPRYTLEPAAADALFGAEKRTRIFALARAPQQARLHDLIRRPGDIIVLDGVRILGNIGAITRTACAFGAAGVVVLDSGLRSVWDRRLIRASRGLVFALPVVLATRAQCTAFLQRERMATAVLSAQAGAPLSAVRTVPERLCFILGSERDGVSAALDAQSSRRLSVPMAADVESLNVSVAAGIALYARSGD